MPNLPGDLPCTHSGEKYPKNIPHCAKSALCESFKKISTLKSHCARTWNFKETARTSPNSARCKHLFIQLKSII